MTFDVAVIGGGVSGLGTAYELTRLGYNVVVLERQVNAGGNAVSERMGGFLMEHGPSSVNAAAMEATNLADDLGLDPVRTDLSDAVKSRYLIGDGALKGISTHPMGFLMSGYLSPLARLRMMVEIAVPRGKLEQEETVAKFWSRRFGQEFSDKVIDPLIGGIYAGRAENLSMNAVFPALLKMERQYGSVTRGILARRFGSAKMPGRRLFSWADGIATLPKTLVRLLGSVVWTGVVVTSVTKMSGGFAVKTAASGTVKARSVIVATQPHVSAGLLEKLDDQVAEAISEIAAPPLAVAFLGFRRNKVEHPLDGLGYLAPDRENRPLSGALFCSTMFRGRAPEGHIALSGYVGGARAPDMALMKPDDIVALAQEEFRDLLGTRGEPVIARVRQWRQGLPQLSTGHGQRLQRIYDAEQRHPGLFVTGNYFTGPAVATCLQQSFKTVGRAHRYLDGQPHLQSLEQTG